MNTLLLAELIARRVADNLNMRFKFCDFTPSLEGYTIAMEGRGHKCGCFLSEEFIEETDINEAVGYVEKQFRIEMGLEIDQPTIYGIPPLNIQESENT